MMRLRNLKAPNALALGAVLFAASFGSMSCTLDPVQDVAVEALGEEKGEANEFHRAGQACGLCHQAGGRAKSDFSVAGTVFVAPDSLVGVDGARIDLVDSKGSAPPKPVRTNCVGNFFVPRDEWNPAFPIVVRVTRGGVSRTMRSQIGREASCAGCHKAQVPLETPLENVPQIYVFPPGTPPEVSATTCSVDPDLSKQASP